MIRRATADDVTEMARHAAALVRLHHGYDAARFFLPERVEEGYAWWFRRELRDEDVVLFVAVEEGHVTGYVYGRMQDRDWNLLLDRAGVIHDIFVDENARRKGVANALLEAAIEALTERGAPRVVLSTAALNEGAQKFFAKAGFRPTMIEMTRETRV